MTKNRMLFLLLVVPLLLAVSRQHTVQTQAAGQENLDTYDLEIVNIWIGEQGNEAFISVDNREVTVNALIRNNGPGRWSKDVKVVITWRIDPGTPQSTFVMNAIPPLDPTKDFVVKSKITIASGISGKREFSAKLTVSDSDRHRFKDINLDNNALISQVEIIEVAAQENLEKYDLEIANIWIGEQGNEAIISVDNRGVIVNALIRNNGPGKWSKDVNIVITWRIDPGTPQSTFVMNAIPPLEPMEDFVVKSKITIASGISGKRQFSAKLTVFDSDGHRFKDINLDNNALITQVEIIER